MRSKQFCLVTLLLFLSACDPTDVPRLSPDGKYIVLLPDVGKENKKTSVALYDVEKGQWQHHVLPEGWSAMGVIWVKDKVLVNADRPKEVKPMKGEPTNDISCWLLDPASGKFSSTAIKPHIALTPFPGIYKGKECLYVPAMEKGTLILSLHDLSELGTLPYEIEGAGDGWMFRIHERKEHGGLTSNIVGIDVFNPEGTKACQISREEIAKACHRDARVPQCVKISSDHKKMVLAFDTSTIFRQAPQEYTYGVFDLSNGKMLWHGGSNGLHGLPAVVGDAVYALEAKSREIYTGERTPHALLEPPPPRSQPTSEVVLARHTAEGRTVVLDLPLKKADRAARYSASADQKVFVLLIEGDNPRILLVPIRDKVDTKDIREIPLK